MRKPNRRPAYDRRYVKTWTYRHSCGHDVCETHNYCGRCGKLLSVRGWFRAKWLAIKYSMTYEINGRKVTKAAECTSDNLRLMLGDMADVERAIAAVRRSVDPASAPDPRVPYQPGDWLKWFADAELSKAKEGS